MSQIREILHDLRSVLIRLERFAAQKTPIDQQVLEVLADDDLSTAAVARLIRRRRIDVTNTLRLMQAEQRITRRNGKWGLND